MQILSRFCFLVLTGEKVNLQPCFFFIIDLFLFVTSGSSTSSLVVVIAIYCRSWGSLIIISLTFVFVVVVVVVCFCTFTGWRWRRVRYIYGWTIFPLPKKTFSFLFSQTFVFIHSISNLFSVIYKVCLACCPPFLLSGLLLQ